MHKGFQETMYCSYCCQSQRRQIPAPNILVRFVTVVPWINDWRFTALSTQLLNCIETDNIEAYNGRLASV